MRFTALLRWLGGLLAVLLLMVLLVILAFRWGLEITDSGASFSPSSTHFLFGRLLVLVVLIGGWPYLMARLACQRKWRPAQLRWAVQQRWRVALWLVLIELVLVQNALLLLLRELST